MKCKWHLFFLLSLPVICWSQEDENQEKKLQLNGYLKDLVTINIADDSTLLDNLIHNRLNLKWYPNDHWTGILELRTRAFFGDQVRTINQISETVPGFPRYSELVDVNNDFFDLSWIIVDEESFDLPQSGRYKILCVIRQIHCQFHTGGEASITGNANCIRRWPFLVIKIEKRKGVE